MTINPTCPPILEIELRLFDLAKSSISAMANRIAQLSSAGAEMALADFSDETAIETKVKESAA